MRNQILFFLSLLSWLFHGLIVLLCKVEVISGDRADLFSMGTWLLFPLMQFILHIIAWTGLVSKAHRGWTWAAIGLSGAGLIFAAFVFYSVLTFFSNFPQVG